MFGSSERSVRAPSILLSAAFLITLWVLLRQTRAVLDRPGRALGRRIESIVRVLWTAGTPLMHSLRFCQQLIYSHLSKF